MPEVQGACVQWQVCVVQVECVMYGLVFGEFIGFQKSPDFLTLSVGAHCFLWIMVPKYGHWNYQIIFSKVRLFTSVQRSNQKI